MMLRVNESSGSEKSKRDDLLQCIRYENVYVHFTDVTFCIISRRLRVLHINMRENVMSLTINRYSERWSPGEEENQRQSLTFKERRRRRRVEWRMGCRWSSKRENLVSLYNEPNLLLLSLRFKGNNVTTLCWCGSAEPFLRSKKEKAKREKMMTNVVNETFILVGRERFGRKTFFFPSPSPRVQASAGSTRREATLR